MAKQKGSAFLLKMDTAVSNGPTYTSVGGLTAKSFKMDEEVVDVTNQDSTGKWRELLSGSGIRKVSISASGMLIKNESTADGRAVFNAFLAQPTSGFKSWQVIIPGLGTLEGAFQISNYSDKGPHDKEVSFDISLESAGAITFTAET